MKEGTVAPRAPGGSSSSSGAPPAAAHKLGPGEFFGEGALLAPGSAFGTTLLQSGARSAGGGGAFDYVADSQRVVVLAMKRAEFERLLGPYEELWRCVGRVGRWCAGGQGLGLRLYGRKSQAHWYAEAQEETVPCFTCPPSHTHIPLRNHNHNRLHTDYYPQVRGPPPRAHPLRAVRPPALAARARAAARVVPPRRDRVLRRRRGRQLLHSAGRRIHVLHQ